jgi:uncharacterized protein (TIGR02391 family)
MKSQLLVSKEKFAADATARIAEGRRILDEYAKPHNRDEFTQLYRNYERWSSTTYAWLGHVFSGERSSYMTAYENAGAWDTNKMQAAWQMRPDGFEYRSKFFSQTVTSKIDYLEDLLAQLEFIPESHSQTPTSAQLPSVDSLHHSVKTAADSLFAGGHYRQAVLDACIALDRAVQVKAQLPAATTGTSLMTKAFSANSPIIRLSTDANEQMGFMNLYQGSVQAIRNHYGHNLTEIPDPARALEWLGFISALFYKLDEALAPATTSTP